MICFLSIFREQDKKAKLKDETDRNRNPLFVLNSYSKTDRKKNTQRVKGAKNNVVPHRTRFQILESTILLMYHHL